MSETSLLRDDQPGGVRVSAALSPPAAERGGGEVDIAATAATAAAAATAASDVSCGVSFCSASDGVGSACCCDCDCSSCCSSNVCWCCSDPERHRPSGTNRRSSRLYGVVCGAWVHSAASLAALASCFSVSLRSRVAASACNLSVVRWPSALSLPAQHCNNTHQNGTQQDPKQNDSVCLTAAHRALSFRYRLDIFGPGRGGRSLPLRCLKLLLERRLFLAL